MGFEKYICMFERKSPEKKKNSCVFIHPMMRIYIHIKSRFTCEPTPLLYKVHVHNWLLLHFITASVDQTWANSGPGAICGPSEVT